MTPRMATSGSRAGPRYMHVAFESPPQAIPVRHDRWDPPAAPNRDNRCTPVALCGGMQKRGPHGRSFLINDLRRAARSVRPPVAILPTRAPTRHILGRKAWFNPADLRPKT